MIFFTSIFVFPPLFLTFVFNAYQEKKLLQSYSLSELRGNAKHLALQIDFLLYESIVEEYSQNENTDLSQLLPLYSKELKPLVNAVETSEFETEIYLFKRLNENKETNQNIVSEFPMELKLILAWDNKNIYRNEYSWTPEQRQMFFSGRLIMLESSNELNQEWYSVYVPLMSGTEIIGAMRVDRNLMPLRESRIRALLFNFALLIVSSLIIYFALIWMVTKVVKPLEVLAEDLGQNEDPENGDNQRDEIEIIAKTIQDSKNEVEILVERYLDNIPGLIITIDLFGVIQPHYSCKDILGTSLAGSSIDYAFGKYNFKISDILAVAIKKKSININSLLELAPDTITLKNNTFALEYFPYENEGEVVGITIFGKDITLEQKLAEQNTKEKVQSQMLINLVKDINLFELFLEETYYGFDEAIAYLKIGLEYNVNEFKRNIHTIKGAAASFSLVDLAKGLDDLESEIDESMELGYLDDSKIMEKLKLLKTDLKGVELKVKDMMGHKLSNKLIISENELDSLLEFAKNKQNDLLTNTLKDLKLPLLESYFETKVSNILKSVVKNFPEKLVELKLECEDSRVSKNTLKVLDAILPHLIRNAIDHGIESVDSRVANGKSKIAELVVSMKIVGKYFELIIQDNGRGVDVKGLCEKVVENKIMSPVEIKKLDEDDKLMLIFTPGLSTATKITQISGRGVGMDAVHQTVKNAGGIIKVSSVLGKETKFMIKLPLEVV